MQVVGIVDASYKSDEKSVGGMLLMISDEQMNKASPVMWKSKQIDRVYHSSKDAEKLALSKLLDEAAYLARQIEMLLFGDFKQRIPLRISIDIEPTLESITSTKKIERKSLRIIVQEMKERLIEGYVSSYQRIPTKEMLSDGMTKEMEMAEGLRKLLKTGSCEMKKEEVNKVIYENDEINMVNVRNRKKKEERVQE